MGRLPVRRVHRRLGLLRAQGGAGDGGRHSHLHPGDRPGAALPKTLHRARKRHHHGHWRPGGVGCGGRHLHPAGTVHTEAGSAPGADYLHLRGGRLPGRPVPDSVAPLLRARDARPPSLPRGHGHHRSPGDRREGRLAGETAVAGHRHFGRLRFSGHHVPRLEGVPGLPVRAGDPHAYREGSHRGELRRHQLHSRPGLRDGPAQLDDPVRRRRAQ